MLKYRILAIFTLILMVSRPVFVAAQSGGIPEGQADPERENVLGARYLQHLYSDQKAIWTAPLKIRDNHLPWLIPFFSTTAGLMVLDSHVARQVPLDLSLRSRSHQLANLGTASLVGSGAFLYLHGRFTHNEHSRETGLLASEAAIDSIATASALKLMSGRERPLQNFEGRFWQGGTSFPSEHAAIAWSVASVLAHEYPDARWQTALYGTAAAISISRVTSRDHFPSDILVGSALGYLIGRQVYRAHHNDDLPGSSTGTFEKEDSGPPSGSADVPLDSWIYPALDRLAALGLVKTNISGLRPWTRAECARLAQEAEASVESESAPPAVASLFQALDAEFSVETGGNEAIAESRIEEVYLRAGVLSGQPLADDYHFAKTIVDDFGRPFGHGLNAILGVSSRSVAGPFAIYIRGEYEHAGTLPQLSNAALHAIAAADATPFAVPLRAGSLDRFRFLESYVALNVRNNMISFGRQSLWWGPGAEAPFLFSNNAEPIPMLRISRSTPFSLPWIFQYLGGIRYEAVWGQLNGQHFVFLQDGAGNTTGFVPPITPHPYFHGEKISFKPTANFEFGFSETTLFGGPGFPLTAHNLLHSYSIANAGAGSPNDPGDRRSAFDFSYRLPGIRNWLTLYADSFTEDEFSPVSYPRKSSFRAGLYAPRLPGIAALDLRVEGLYSDIPNLDFGTDAGIEYFNSRFRSGYTNFGQIIGSWIGREGRGLSARSTYHFSAQSNVQLHFRNQHVNPAFLGGGQLNDFGASASFALRRAISVGGSAQYEHWGFPVLSTVPHGNLNIAFELRVQPAGGWKIW